IKDSRKQIKGLEFIFIELKKFAARNRAEKKLKDLWLRYLTEINEATSHISPDLMENREISEAVKYVEIGAYTKAQLFKYDRFRDGILTEVSVLSDAEQKGIEKGMEIGMEKGLKTVAVSCLKKGMSPEDIRDLTGLTIEEILALRG
ncbi:MAG: PD-(D/E)XK nuclease family transposase, partial [Tannerella sp.]|nr:PD-(D/E)XK nuclease family transposase [Tannerella sp.]